MSYAELESRLLHLIAEGKPFTADDVTDNGNITVQDHNHLPNQAQNAIGLLIRNASQAGDIVPTGRTFQSKAPHRKGGMIREWKGNL